MRHHHKPAAASGAVDATHIVLLDDWGPYRAGKVLCGLVRRIDKDMSCLSLGTPEDLDTVLQSMTNKD